MTLTQPGQVFLTLGRPLYYVVDYSDRISRSGKIITDDHRSLFFFFCFASRPHAWILHLITPRVWWILTVPGHFLTRFAFESTRVPLIASIKTYAAKHSGISVIPSLTFPYVPKLNSPAPLLPPFHRFSVSKNRKNKRCFPI